MGRSAEKRRGMTPTAMYTDFAKVYDLLMQDVDYDAWAAHLLRLLRLNGVQDGSAVCECACGTGSLTIPLQKAGFRMTGVDLSDKMLEEAMRKARASGCLLPFIRQDMTRLSLPRKADAILCTCDGVNYLSPESLPLFLSAACSNLKSGGVLLFDLSTPWKLKNLLGNQSLTRREDSFVYLWDNAWDDKKQCVHLDLTVFLPEADGRYRRVDETQTQYAHERPFLRECLRKAGFVSIRFYGKFRLSGPREKDDRWHVLAVRP